MSNQIRAALLTTLLAGSFAAGCGRGGAPLTAVQVTVHLGDGVPTGVITTLRVTVEDERRTATRDFLRTGSAPLAFPITFGIELGRDVNGPVRVDVRGLDVARGLRARGSIEALRIVSGETRYPTAVYLQCSGDCRVSDAAAPGAADAGAPGGARDAAPDGSRDGGQAVCGNGKIDPGEICDVALASSRPGGCPAPGCEAQVACISGQRRGSLCAAFCTYTEITTVAGGDRCCPANATNLTDPDCSPTCGNGTIERGETCDLRIPAPEIGACPMAGDCEDGDACTTDLFVSANTCAARCLQVPITTFGPDGCCPPGGTSTSDPDCPRVCGNGVVEGDEICDIGIAAGRALACPTTCNDRDTCTMDMLEGSGCRATCRSVSITQYISGDRCCPPGGNRNVDSDCQAACGNAVVEPGETCDRAIMSGRPGACATACPDEAGCLPNSLQGSANDCTARCLRRTITTCMPGKDGCCATGCTSTNDGDCSPACGNGVVEEGETCDLAVATGLSACPRSCVETNPCMPAELISGGTCNARCQRTPITAFVTGDRCCPAGGNNGLDGDCPAVCGNAVVEAPKETCDKSIAAGASGACPTVCPPPNGCRRPLLQGELGACTARCELEPITACVPNDGCCPAGCNRNNDIDCAAVCGNAVVEAGEACDRGITAGNPGACAGSCDDNNPCTMDGTSGRAEDCTRTCSHPQVTACAAGDRCCPVGCTGMTDGDCAPTCGNTSVEKDETCDPPSSCPTTCPDDDDPCTSDKLQGSPASCTAVCTHSPITTCSGQTTDRCCPTGCSAMRDVDCAGGPDAGS